MNPLKLTEQIAADIRARAKTIDLKAVEKIRKAKDENGTFDVIISTEDLDRAGEIVKQSGWDLANYKNNPIVLWGHDYYSLPIGVTTETYETTYHGVPALGARGVFLSADINPFAQQVRKLYEFGLKHGQGVGCTTSVGFIPKEFDNDNGRIITRSELLEFSFVPVPANQGVGPAEGRALTFDEARELGIDMVGMKTKGMEFAALRGIIPQNDSEVKATERTKWTAPKLEDFTKKAWADLTVDEKTEIASHFAYVKASGTTNAFEDFLLPIRRASDGAVVWHGVKAAMTDLLSEKSVVEVEGDRKAVYDHLAKLYTLFNKEAPEFKVAKEAEAGDHCEMDDGASGILSADPKDPDGPMVCIPQEQDKTAKGEHSSQKDLLKALADEHTRHTGEVEKCFEAFKTAASEEGSISDMVKELRASLSDEHTMHRANSVKCFRSFDPSEDKALDKTPHLKALRGAHDDYEATSTEALNEFETKCTKSEANLDDHIDLVTSKVEANENAHKKSVTKIAKGMCRAAFGEDDQADEKTLAILTEFLAPHIDKQILPAIVSKVGAAISTATKKKIAEAHSHMKAAQSVLEALHGGLADGNDEEGRSDEGKILDDGRRENRSKSRAPSHVDPALRAHVEARETLREVESIVREGLKNFNFEIRGRSK